MESAIRALYDSDLFPEDRRAATNPEYAQVLEYQERHENDLVSKLTEAQKETFEKYKDCAAEIGLDDGYREFATGFRLGLRLMAEAILEQP